MKHFQMLNKYYKMYLEQGGGSWFVMPAAINRYVTIQINKKIKIVAIARRGKKIAMNRQLKKKIVKKIATKVVMKIANIVP